MANEVSIYDPRYLAEVVRTTPPVHTFFLDTYFSNIKTFPTKGVDIDIVKGDRQMASFVHPLVGGQVLRDQGYKTESFTPPLINPLTITTANDALERAPGEDLYSGKTPEERAAQQLIEDYKRLDDAATRREEWMAVKTIMDGQIPIIGNGVSKVIDFGFTNKVKLEGTKQWGKSAAKPLDDLEDWVDQVLTNGFANVDHAVMGKTALRNFLADAEVQKMLDNRRIELGKIDPKDLPNGVRYIGHLNKPNLDIYSYGEVYEYFARSWRSDVTAAKPICEDGYTVYIYFLLKDGRLPTEEECRELERYFADIKKPMGDLVVGVPPEEVPYSINLTYYIASSNVKNAGLIQENVEKAVEEYKTWQRKIGLDIDPAELIMRVREAGAKRPRLTAPVDTVVSKIQVSKVTECKITYGGIEDD